MTRVLIVDDDPVQLRLTAEVTRRAGFTPVTASGGDEALKLLRTDPGFGAMILDLVMPDRDGMAVMDALQRDGLTVPVIVQTAHSSLETVVSAMRNGAADFFVKPVAPERLIVLMSLRPAIPRRVALLHCSLPLHRAIAMMNGVAGNRQPPLDRGWGIFNWR